MNRPVRQTPAQMQAACDRFNATHNEGDTITVYSGVIGENPQDVEIRYPAQILGGHTAVVYVTGGSGCIALSHVKAKPRASEAASPEASDPGTNP